MGVMEKIMEIYNKLKSDLENTGLVINNDRGVSNVIILALAEAFENGMLKGEEKGLEESIKVLQRTYEDIKS